MRDLAKEIETQPWILLGANALPIYITIYPPLYTRGFKEKYGSEADIMNVAEGQKVHWYMRGDQLDTLAETVLPEVLHDGWGWYERCMRELGEFQVFNQQFLKTDLAVLSEADVWGLMKEYREQFEGPFTTNNAIETLSYYFQHRLKALLAEAGMRTAQIDSLIEQYGQSARPNYVKACAEAYRRATTEDERELVRKKYYFVLTDYVGPHETTHAELEELVAKTPYECAPMFTTDGISARAQALLTALQVIATVQDLRKAELLEMVHAAHRFGVECARRNNVALDDIKLATWQEVEDGTWKIDDLKARCDPFVMFWSLDGFQVAVGAEAARLVALTHKHLLALDRDATEVRGICASKGTARGRAVVVFRPEEFERVEEGNILITMMTRPEFLPIMHKAAAFVCDEGGITSHAAIVAREMKKPCIIGTKNGTRVLKDGDLVEVDAEKGIVTILERV